MDAFADAALINSIFLYFENNFVSESKFSFS